MDQEVTSTELMAIAGVTGINTLRQWVVRGLIPEPTIRKHPSGRGTISYWPEWVKMRAIQIRELREAGKTRSIDDILLKEDWESVKKAFQQRSRRRYRFQEASAKMDRQHAEDEVTEGIKDQAAKFARERLGEMTESHWQLESRCIDEAIELLKQGMNPVVIVDGESLYVTPDIAVGIHIENRRKPEQAFFIIPIAETILQEIPSLIPLTKEGTIRHSATAIRRTGKLTSKLRVTATKAWQVKIESSRKPATSK